MRVQVDQPGRDDVALYVAHFARVDEIVADLGNLSTGERHVGHAVDVLGRVDHAPALQDQIVGHVVSRSDARVYRAQCSIRRSRNLPHFSSSLMAMNSSALCAWSIEPGPQTTVGIPA